MMNKNLSILLGSLFILVIAMAACNSKPKSSEDEKATSMEAEKGAHEHN